MSDNKDQELASPIASGDPGKKADRVLHIGLRALGIGLGIFFLWAIFAPLDEGVPTQGAVSIDTKRKTIQHLNGGIVREVLVREGQVVKQGQVLLRLDEANTKAAYEAGRQQYLGARATESRLLAEQSGLPKIEFHPDLVEASTESFVAQLIRNQEMLFSSRQAAFKAEQASINESIAATEAQVKGYTGLLESRRAQQALLKEELAGVRDLVAEGYAPRSRQMELERALADATGSVADIHGNQMRSQRNISEMRQRAIQRQQEFRRDIDSQLADIRREAQAGQEKYVALKNDLARTEIRSPADGQVVGLAIQTVGGVIQSGQKIMDIVPEGAALLVETHVPPQYIDRVQVGGEADIRFNAFAHSPQLVVKGRVESISRDLVIDPLSNAAASQQVPPYYLARITVTQEGLKDLGRHNLQPGMSAEVIIKTGARSLMTYLLHPIIRRLSNSLKEE